MDRLIDWGAPWLAHLRPLQALLRSAAWRTALSEAARERRVVSGYDVPIEFVEHDAAGKMPYELFIATTGRVPTRDNLHDRFNALIWLAYPRAKAALNARQAAELERNGVGPARGAVRDAATLIDESAVLLRCPDDQVAAALAGHDWQRLLIDWRGRWGRDILALPFGHALLEKLGGPFKAITACAVPLPAVVDVDAVAATFIARSDLAPSLLPHLPVLGIPGWCAENADPRFYDDPRVFRPRRRDRSLRSE
ncbi:MAG TPA: DUF3025 domain-containing protein [Burkholderiaceae bacterium]|nr:DUF3025 domain-containing protein [Burkholderiaceae bacterium]